MCPFTSRHPEYTPLGCTKVISSPEPAWILPFNPKWLPSYFLHCGQCRSNLQARDLNFSLSVSQRVTLSPQHVCTCLYTHTFTHTHTPSPGLTSPFPLLPSLLGGLIGAGGDSAAFPLVISTELSWHSVPVSHLGILLQRRLLLHRIIRSLHNHLVLSARL